MSELVVSADFGEPSVREEGGEIRRWDEGLPSELIEAMLAWNARYQEIVQLSEVERTSGNVVNLISQLDEDGIRLCEQISRETGASKVRYYSEGRFAYLT